MGIIAQVGTKWYTWFTLQKPSWAMLQKRMIFKCRAASKSASVAFEKEETDYRSTSSILTSYIKHAEQLADEIGDIVIAVALQVDAHCPEKMGAFKDMVPQILTESINGGGGANFLISDSYLPVSVVLEREWDQIQKAELEKKWERVLYSLVERQISRVNLALDDPQPQIAAPLPVQPTKVQDQPQDQVRDPKNNPKMISLAQASFEFNIPRSSLTAAAKKEPGESGFLASIKVGYHRYFYRDDLRKHARSREAYRRKPRS